MPPLTHSPFLQALGYSIINSLWQFALLWLIYVLINTVFKLSSRQKYSAGYLLQTGGFVWFIVTFAVYFSHYSLMAKNYFSLHTSYSLYISSREATTIREKFFAWLIQTERFLPYLSVIYLVLLIFIAVKWIKAYNFTQSVRSGGLYTIEVDWQLFVKQLSARLGIKREVKIYLSEKVKTPLTIGFFKPFILIPLASLNHLDTDQMEAVILHELAHIKRFDYLFNLFLALIEIALFFNPFTILIGRQIKRERENCCDDWVLQYNYNAASYAGALLQIATHQSSAHLLALKAADNKQVLLGRIKRMIEKKEKNFFNHRYQLMALLVMITVLGSLALLSSYHTANDTALLLLPVKAASGQIIAKAGTQSNSSILHFVQLPEKFNLKKDGQAERYVKRKVSLHISLPQTIIKNKNIESRRQQINNELLPAEAIEALFAKDYQAIAEEALARESKEPNIRLNEMLAAGIQLKERQIALAEERFKKVAADVFKQNKTFFKQKQFREQMKAALEQIKAAQIQLQSAQRTMRISRANKNTLSANEAAYFLQLSQNKIEKPQLSSRQWQGQTEKEKKQCLEPRAFDSVFYQLELKLPQEIFQLSLQNKTPDFSYQFSETPKVKVVLTNAIKKYKKAKKINKVFMEEERSENRNISPSIQEFLPEAISINKSFYVISI